MVYHVDGKRVTALDPTSFDSLDLTEADIEEWIIETPSILGEDLLVVASQYAKFDRAAERPDVLALDPDGKLVVIEVKRDRADKTTDLQAIKYASYCSTISAEELQQDYRAFWNKRRDEDDQLTPEKVGERFTEFLGEDIVLTEDGYADFVLDDRPRILLAAGGFGPEITTPVVWLEREYGMDITCIELDVHQRDEEVFVSARQVLPIPEAEEYMAKRRQKERQQSRSSSRAERAITVLLEAGLVEEGDIVLFDGESLPDDAEREYDSEDDFW
ncbi:PDDEXK family nuclease [Halorussus salinus]|uniref:endonuclease NucS domain-containing protein n=1 Tax=Halorussus salinus TaxID=1364935 RepID=UPI00109265D9|nr:endonuclease NucS domain-containing protein [Halorussus salinus]